MLDRIKTLLREPALLIDAFESAIVLAVALGMFHLTGESQRDLIALFIAALALGKGILTRPFPVTVVPDLGRAALVFFGSVHLTHLTADQITLVATFLGTLMTLLQRSQISPTIEPAPVRAAGQDGAVTLPLVVSAFAVLGLAMTAVVVLLF